MLDIPGKTKRNSDKKLGRTYMPKGGPGHQPSDKSISIMSTSTLNTDDVPNNIIVSSRPLRAKAVVSDAICVAK